MIIPEGWGHLDFWRSKEWKDVLYKLKTLEDAGVQVLPQRVDLLRALSLCRFDRCRVAFLLQDPYPDRKTATGVALSAERGIHTELVTIPVPLAEGERPSIPRSLRTIYRELSSDLSIPYPSRGCLEEWCDQGVLLWNVTPTIEIDENNKSWSHGAWPEWKELTKEIVERLSASGHVVFVFFGVRAQKYAEFVDTNGNYNSVLKFTHPSPQAQRFTNNPIKGSRLFSTINQFGIDYHYHRWGTDPIDWRIE